MRDHSHKKFLWYSFILKAHRTMLRHNQTKLLLMLLKKITFVQSKSSLQHQTWKLNSVLLTFLSQSGTTIWYNNNYNTSSVFQIVPYQPILPLVSPMHRKLRAGSGLFWHHVLPSIVIGVRSLMVIH